jgi:hypothetical protein
MMLIVHHRRLHDQRRDPALELAEHARERGRVVERDRAREVGDRLRITAAVRDAARVVALAEGLERGVHGDHHGVVVPVVRALDLEDHIAARGAARHVDRVHRRLGAGVGEAPLRQAEAPGELLGDHDRPLGGRGEVRALLDAALDGVDDYGVRVADAHDAEAVVEVDVLVAVHVPDLGARAALDVDGPGVVLLERGRDALGHYTPGALVVLARPGRALGEQIPLLIDQPKDAPPVDFGRGRDRCGRLQGHGRSLARDVLSQGNELHVGSSLMWMEPHVSSRPPGSPPA